MLEIRGIDHIVMRTADMEAMIGFYQGVLNCSLERELPDLGLVQLRAGAALIDLVTVDGELGKQGGEAPSQTGRNVDHFCLTIAPLGETELSEYLVQQGLSVPEFSRRYGAQGYGRSVYINDPEGNIVELKIENSAASS